MLSLLDDAAQLSLANLLNLSLQQDKIPENWWWAEVVSICKSDQSDRTKNYGLVSLLSTVLKAMERCAKDKLVPSKLAQPYQVTATRVYKKEALPRQHPVVNRRTDCETWTRRPCESLLSWLAEGLRPYRTQAAPSNVYGNIINWIRDYLTRSSFHLRADAVNYSKVKVYSGLVRGSLLFWAFMKTMNFVRGQCQDNKWSGF